MSIETGGPAFPGFEYFTDGRTLLAGKPFGGMTLRDYFAARAMQSIILAVCAGQHSASQEAGIAADAYKMADALLAARSNDK